MPQPRRFRAKLPVLSRLAIAWCVFAAIAVAAGAFFAAPGASGPGEVAFAIDDDVARRLAEFGRAEARRAEAPQRADAPQAAGPADALAPQNNVEEDIEVASLAEDVAPSSSEPAADLGTAGEIRLVDAEPPSVETNDIFADEAAPVATLAQPAPRIVNVREGPSDVVITIDGAPARAPKGTRGAVSPLEAALAPTAIAAPVAALSRKTAYGRAPAIAADGRRASRLYARDYEPPKDAPTVALIVGGLGLNARVTERAIEELPSVVTLAFAPYAKGLDGWAAAARAAGHEFLLELPMQHVRRNGVGADALGPAALRLGRPWTENAARLDWLMSRTDGYFGVTNYLGAAFADDPSAIGPVLARVRAAGLAYVDDAGLPARLIEGDVAQVSRVIAGNDDLAAVERDLRALERSARAGRPALAKAYVSGATLDALVSWSWGLADAGVALAPASHVMRPDDDARRGEAL
ncbi:MAG: divergent polysaccharide deacetylase family protein [Parvularculaceae bacterium]